MISRRDVAANAAFLSFVGFGVQYQAHAKAQNYKNAIENGIAYLQKQAQAQLPLARTLTDALRLKDMAKAKEAYLASRPPYEEIEVLASSFPELDSAIDSRPYAFPDGESDLKFMGFHKVEMLIFGEGDLAAALPVSEKLEANLLALTKQLGEARRFTAKSSFDGMISLANEIAAKKISSEEETWSDSSLMIFKHNARGIQSQLTPFLGDLSKRNETHALDIQNVYQKFQSHVDQLHGTRLGGTPYSMIGMSERRVIARNAIAYRDALQKSAELLRVAG